MSGEVFLYILLGLVLLLYARRWWIGRSIPQYSPSEVREKLHGTINVILLDIRTNRERKGGHIKGSIHIPLHELIRRAGELEKQKAREIICYCANGNRSITAAARLRRLGFNAASMKGGITEWNYEQLKA